MQDSQDNTYLCDRKHCFYNRWSDKLRRPVCAYNRTLEEFIYSKGIPPDCKLLAYRLEKGPDKA